MDAQSNNHPYTIVRIKRKRTDEPLDALGVLLVPPVRKVKFLCNISRRVPGSQKEVKRWSRCFSVCSNRREDRMGG